MNKRCDIVNCLKGVAIILVILVHSTQYFDVPEGLRCILSPAQLGSQIFFVLSAYTLSLSYDKKRPTYLEFVKRRISRVAVGYWTMILVNVFLKIFKAVAVDKIGVASAINFKGVIVNSLFLNGLSSSIEINNHIVRGGWFVGTIFLLYLIFPFMFKLFEMGNKIWKKMHPIIFSIIIFIISSIIMISLSLKDERFVCRNNSLMYFSFLNQISCFSIGFVIYGIQKNCLFDHIKYPLLKSIISFSVAIFLFCVEYKYSFIFFPFLVGIGVLYIVCFLKNKHIEEVSKEDDSVKESMIRNLLQIFGKNSFSIYLTHFFIVWDFSRIVVKVFRMISENDVILYIIMIPVMYVLSLTLGVVFSKYIKKMERLLRLI